MRTLIFGSIRPWVPFGGGMRVRSTSLALARLGAVDLVLLKHPTAPDDDPPLPHFDRVHAVRDRFDIAENRRLLAESLPAWAHETHYDIVWFNQERVWLTAQGLVRGTSIVDVDDLQDVVLERWLTVGTAPDGTELTPDDRQRMATEIVYWRNIHQRVSDEANVIVFSSEHDRRRFAFDNSVVVPNTYGKTATVTKHRSLSPTILYQGYMQWSTNEDAALWLAQEIMPRVRRAVPHVRLVLVGAASARVRALDAMPGIDVIGAVPDMHPYLAHTDVLVAPLRVAGGTRIKILEAFAHRIPVVTTPIGAEGLDATHGVHLLLAEQADDLAAACVRLLQDHAAARQLADRAHGLYEQAYQPEHAFTAVEEAVRLALSAGIEGRLARERNVWLCTLRRDGSPHVTPVWFVHDDGVWWIGCDSFSVKVRNLVANSRVSLALEDGDAPVVAEGMAEILRSDFPAEIVAAFAEKYAGWDVRQPTRPGAGRVLLRIPVTRWLLAGTAQ